MLCIWKLLWHTLLSINKYTPNNLLKKSNVLLNQKYQDFVISCGILMIRVFANGPGDLGSIPGWVIPKTQKMVLDAFLLKLSITRYGSKVKRSNPGKGILPSSTPWCSSYRKESFRVTLNYDWQLNFTFYLWSNSKPLKV